MVAMTQTAEPTDKISTGFDFLVGTWDVAQRRFHEGSTDSFSGTSSAWTYLGGAVSVEELSVPDRDFAGMALRIYSPETQQWSVHWISSRSGVIDAPVVGDVGPDGCRLVGVEEADGASRHVTYEWFDLSPDLARWQQQVSNDGQRWDLDWEMEFRRTAEEPVLLDTSYLPKVAGDFDFMNGTIKVRNERLKERLAGCTEWTRFEHTQHGRPHLNGGVSVDQNVMPGLYTGLTFRAYDIAADEWAIHWIDHRNPELGESVRGRFENGVGEFYGDDQHQGTPVRVRFRWDVRDPAAPTWEQAFSTDDGETWETNWRSFHTKVA